MSEKEIKEVILPVLEKIQELGIKTLELESVVKKIASSLTGGPKEAILTFENLCGIRVGYNELKGRLQIFFANEFQNMRTSEANQLKEAFPNLF